MVVRGTVALDATVIVEGKGHISRKEESNPKKRKYMVGLNN